MSEYLIDACKPFGRVSLELSFVMFMIWIGHHIDSSRIVLRFSVHFNRAYSSIYKLYSLKMAQMYILSVRIINTLLKAFLKAYGAFIKNIIHKS